MIITVKKELFPAELDVKVSHCGVLHIVVHSRGNGEKIYLRCAFLDLTTKKRK